VIDPGWVMWVIFVAVCLVGVVAIWLTDPGRPRPQKCYDIAVRFGRKQCWSLCRRDPEAPCKRGSFVRF